MAELEIQPLTERLSDEEIEELTSALSRAGAPKLPKTSGNDLTVAEALDEEVLDELLDRLESLDAACEIYLPVEFEGRLTVGDRMVGSAHGLLEALSELKEELWADEDEDLDEDEELAGADVALGDLRELWKLLHDGAAEALDRGLPLHVVT